VVGIDANIHAVSLLEDLKQEPQILEKVVAAVRYGERRWNLVLKDDITVKMPERDFMKALKYLSKLHEKNKLFEQDYKIIDLRDGNKYYIEKKPPQNKSNDI
jgi:cell division protein FtsQ